MAGFLFKRSARNVRLCAPAFEMQPGKPRILAYCASNIGMGHYGRLSRVLARVREKIPECSLLLATDLRPGAGPLPDGIELLRLPGFRFEDDDAFRERPEILRLSSKQLALLRSNVLLAAGVSFQPHLLLLDTNPHGKRDELLPLLRHLRAKAGRQRVFLMLRDIPCAPGEKFKLSGPPSQMAKHAAYYDRILVSGARNFYDIGESFGWSQELEEKTLYAGFVVPSNTLLSREEAFSFFPALDAGKRTVVCSFGGGWEVENLAPLIVTGFLAASKAAQPMTQLALFAGPAVEEAVLENLRVKIGDAGGVALFKFTPHFPALLAHCDLALLQAGSTAFQLLDTTIPMLLYSRDYKIEEQKLRAERLCCFPGIRQMTDQRLSAAAWQEGIRWGLTCPRVQRQTGFAFDGLETIAREIADTALNLCGGL